MKKQAILVPYDFTKVADTALAHAVVTAKTIDGKVKLLHIVDDKSVVEEKLSELTKVAQKAQAESGIDIEPLVRVGNIFDDIGDTAAELNAKLIFMGTHGVKGINQKLFGSYAMRVIKNSEAPFIVVQDKQPKPDGYKNIVVPLDLSTYTKQKLALAAEVARYFKSKIHLLVPNAAEEEEVRILKGNILFAKKYLSDHNVAFTTKITEGDNFRKDIIKYAVSIDADLISIMNENEGFLGGSDEQAILTNEALIPVMVVNPKKVGVTGGVGLFS